VPRRCGSLGRVSHSQSQVFLENPLGFAFITPPQPHYSLLTGTAIVALDEVLQRVLKAFARAFVFIL
jgi:hypothetical protein